MYTRMNTYIHMHTYMSHIHVHVWELAQITVPKLVDIYEGARIQNLSHNVETRTIAM